MIDNRIVIIDGNSLINRAYYALPPLITKEGQYTNALYGFITMLLKIYDDYDPEYIGVAFDLKAPTFRHKEFTDYKLGRKKMLPELAQQLEPLKKVLDAMNIYRVEIEGFEADDLIGTLSNYCQKREMECLIVTGDRDALQLASKTTKILITKKGISNLAIYDDAQVMEEYQVTPLQFIDVKGLMGDKSDNIPGVPGIGEKTAIKLINQFGSVEELIKNTHEITSSKVREKIEAHIDDIVLSKRLATIITEVPVEIDIDHLKRKDVNYQEIIELFKEYEFNSLINRFSNKEVQEVQEVSADSYVIIQNIDQLEAAKKKLMDSEVIAINTIDYGSDRITDGLLAITLATSDEEVYVIDFRDTNDGKIIETLKEILEDEKTSIICHDAKEKIIHFSTYDINIQGITFDTMIGEYLIDPAKSSYSLLDLSLLYFNERITDIDELKGKGKQAIKIIDIDKDQLYKSLYQQVRAVQKLTPLIQEKIKDLNLERLFYEVELPLASVLASMELVGIKVDQNILLSLEKEFGEKINQLTSEIYTLAETEFNINSPKQLGEVLFDKLGLPPIKKTKTGYSTNAEVLDKLMDRHEIIGKIVEYRQLTKLKSTYVDGLLKIINSTTGRIHSSFNQTVTTTGRISSTEPNLQNIPVRLEMGRQLRKVFIAEEGYTLVDADYSQIELRVLADISEDKNLLDAFEKNQDIHTRTASEIFNVQMDEVTSSMRSSAKAVNFGIVYGISDFGLGENLNISRAKAKEYIESYLDKYQGVKRYMEEIVASAKANGYVLTLLNRRRYLPEIHSSNYNVRSFGERMAMNTPIQGTAADIIKIAMVKVHKNLKKNGLSSRLILQVHDELIVEALQEETEKAAEILKNSMEEAMELKAKLKVDLSTGSSWYEAK
ncbi:DNA polymerase I [Alkaliphilus serpentinus]|uniref:DNA polymerase I n=1 Tax=Alkaliphilus serpentinus TaxID=1482731 RepID=A0A833HM70_9FIRM|nr:DNA polymerase I [Alkaliphilus serpentinus]KAB3527259.1 DNA polymerase I [Alkaliphilus serpentinus]